MNEQIDTSDGAPLNTQAAVSDRYGSTLTSDRASVGHPSTGDAPHPVRGRANENSRTAPVGVSQQPRPRRRTRTTICVDAVDRGIGRALRWGKNNWMSLIDVALTVAGTFVLELHWRNAVRVCVWMIGDTGDCGYGCMNYAFEIRELHFSEAWLQWVQAEAVLKILIAGACVVSFVPGCVLCSCARSFLQRVSQVSRILNTENIPSLTYYRRSCYDDLVVPKTL